MADNYIKNLNDNYASFLLAINTIIRLDPRRINQHENPQEKHNVPNEQYQIVIPPQNAIRKDGHECRKCLPRNT